MKKKMFLLIMLFLFLFLIILPNNIYARSINPVSLFFNPLGIIFGEISFGMGFFIDYHNSIFFYVDMLNATLYEIETTGLLFGAGAKYFFDVYEGFNFIAAFSIGSLKMNNVNMSASVLSLGMGYRFRINNFFIEPEIGLSSFILRETEYGYLATDNRFSFGLIMGFYF